MRQPRHHVMRGLTGHRTSSTRRVPRQVPAGGRREPGGPSAAQRPCTVVCERLRSSGGGAQPGDVGVGLELANDARAGRADAADGTDRHTRDLLVVEATRVHQQGQQFALAVVQAGPYRPPNGGAALRRREGLVLRMPGQIIEAVDQPLAIRVPSPASRPTMVTTSCSPVPKLTVDDASCCVAPAATSSWTAATSTSGTWAAPAMSRCR
jgi:hypothetical protein